MKKYDEQFQKDAVNHLIVSGKTIDATADSLSVSKSALSKWKHKYQTTATTNDTDKDKELSRLQRENLELRQELNIVKKSVAIFLKPQR